MRRIVACVSRWGEGAFIQRWNYARAFVVDHSDRRIPVCQAVFTEQLIDMTVSDFALLQLPGVGGLSSGGVPEMIHILRKHLGMEVAFLAEFLNGNREIKLVDADEENCLAQPGLCTTLESSYCKLIIDGKLPNIMRDVGDYPLATALPVTAELGIRSYISVPIYLEDGTTYGTLCCYSHTPDISLNERDLGMMRACAEMTAKQVDQQRMQTHKYREMYTRIKAIMAANELSMMYQPIYELQRYTVVGFEALARFAALPETSPHICFNEAHEIGMGTVLESRAIKLGLEALNQLDPSIYVAVNISPDTILSDEFAQLFDGAPLDRVTLEVTEHATVERYAEVETALAPLRQRGMQLAVDDAGAGFSSFRHILELAPDRIKLDCSLTKNIDSDPARRALVAAFVRFAKDTGAKLIAEGVETETELRALQDLGVEKAQGYFLGWPVSLQEAINVVHGVPKRMAPLTH